MSLKWEYFERYIKEQKKYIEYIKNLKSIGNDDANLQIKLLQEEIWVKDLWRIRSTAYFFENFPDNYPTLDELIKREAERRELSLKKYQKEINKRLELLQAKYNSKEDYADLSKRYLIEELKPLINNKIEKNKIKNKVKYNNILKFINDCIADDINFSKNIYNYIFNLDEVLYWCMEELKREIITSFSTKEADISCIRNCEIKEPSKEKMELIKEINYRLCYEIICKELSKKNLKMRAVLHITHD